MVLARVLAVCLLLVGRSSCTCTDFTPINTFSEYYNLPACATDCLSDNTIGVQAALKCTNANCACTQFNNGITYASNCVNVKCTTNTAMVNAATQCWGAFCTSVAAHCGFTLEALTTPSSSGASTPAPTATEVPGPTGPSTADIIGICIGVPTFVVIVVGVCFQYIWRPRQHRVRGNAR